MENRKNTEPKTSSAPKKAFLNRAKLKLHLKKIRNAKPKVEHKIGVVNINEMMGLYRLPHEGYNVIEHVAANKTVLIDLAQIFLKPVLPKCIPMENPSLKAKQNRVLKKKLEKIQSDNHMLLERITAIKNAKQPRQMSTDAPKEPQLLVPPNIVKRFERIVELPKNISLQNKIFRPKIFFELEAKEERALGRITFQLFTEACPVLVLQLVNFFANGTCEKIRFPRLYASLWAESEISLGRRNFDCVEIYDMQALDYGNQPGTLCFALQDFELLKQGILVFTINFRPITVKDGKRFAFGKLIGGRSRFLCLHEYGSKRGKPHQEIIVTNMGIL